MRAVHYADFGPADVLRVEEVQFPVLRPNDLIVRVHAAGVNRADILQRNGFYAGQHFGESHLLGLELAGEVRAVGSDVTGFETGDRVMAIVGGGAYADAARVDQAMAVKIPDSLTWIEGGAIMESFVTAVEVLHHLANIKSGQTVLIHAAAGGIGSACVQLAAALGARVIATTSAVRAPDVHELGADVVLDRQPELWEAGVKVATEGKGVDAVIDFVGGSYLAPSLQSLREGGTLVQVGVLSEDADVVIPLNLVLHNHLRLLGTVMKSRTVAEKRDMIERFKEIALPLFANGTLRPVVYATVPLQYAGEAHRMMEAGGGVGKIVLTCD
ncbi:NAD(P)H-quinone oxidoreductase [Gluconobacter kanchanaburiensis]|uniref:NADPH:quinone oxidoreductase n=1 Tax=Gluconobacter kanchanaburiensis NBRC 103587 TaxID=1307948 RepID=A0A511BAF1_9PROT|nr:NAD(P)H-quinone oxidoreductase [Gluconobacter kanchanaburiensis]MBF0863041.1 NAD(P)H-quinone oxidoreductase [Gluconobacter kanchanaburiensis]GBR71802.1 NADH/NADPH quinone oxidoreductase [Gluconobacter kanchanaburiensis NBRC 103587]GEK97395.1 NADPH:quinone oxidoreductase [Gluconobacter kanchanaburiensis NBRC 103587]